MDFDERYAELQAEYGPPPTDPMERSTWLHGIELVARAPDALQTLVETNKPIHDSLREVFDGFLAAVEADVVWEFVRKRCSEPLRAATERVLDRPLWAHLTEAKTAVQKTRVLDRLTEEVADNVARLIFFNPIYRSWFTDF